MNKVSMKLIVFFEDPFWSGVIELVDGNDLCVVRKVFVSEPKEQDIILFLKGSYDELTFSPSVAVTNRVTSKNPKRLQREARKQMQQKPLSTKSQLAMKLAQEEQKLLKKEKRSHLKAEKTMLKFEKKQQKKKMKHKGR